MKLGLYIICLLTMAGCISNDIPLPVIYGNVEKIEFRGQEQCVINTQNRTVTVTLADTVDIQNVLLKSLAVTAKPAREHEILIEATTNLATDTVLNLSNPITFTISTYQEYQWTIIAEQNINYSFTVENQVGDEVVNVKDKMVKVYVPLDQDLTNMTVIEAILGPSIATYSPDPLSLTNFSTTQEIAVTCFGRTETWRIIAFKTSATEPMTKDVNAWAKIAYLQGRKPSGIDGETAFEYKRAQASQWTRVAAQGSGRDFSAKVTGLNPNTSYVCRAIVGETIGEELNFTTELAAQVSHSNFDTWYSTADENKVNFNIGVKGEISWDSGNRGGAGFGFEPTKSTTDATKGQAACLTSVYALVKFAAGSIYTGQFDGLDGLNAKIRFGIPYTSRPTSLNGYYKYNPVTITKYSGYNEKYNWLLNTTDSCHIYIALCDWKEPFLANSAGTGTFVDLSPANKSIIALGELKHNQTISDYTKFKIDLEYRDYNKKPTYILIVGTSSKYGDYFIGGVGSKLYLDELELGFD
ncbi:MAG: PCMD domain-containing protein [Marinifilaceae bacterium]